MPLEVAAQNSRLVRIPRQRGGSLCVTAATARIWSLLLLPLQKHSTGQKFGTTMRDSCPLQRMSGARSPEASTFDLGSVSTQ